ncbi:PREDICTED: uncharacterized protein LOC109211983 [Nicotiana attenuata]|uniref:uncharacterized protein LOC109211983 n=1 Tax=Nicotiana attenuata TaxID=49451 RepID=UPI000904BE28|nr:PREDICTED: uncharacterized protein LOC109211983 [Nicotiana attenuata]
MNQNAQYENTYNPSWRNHQNFSWGGNQASQNQYRPQGNYNQLESPPQQRQIGQLAAQQNTRPTGALPSDTDKNPQVNVVTFRNGRELEEVPKIKKEKVTPKGKLVPQTVVETEKEIEESEKTPIARPPPPFPQRLKKKSDDGMFSKFFDTLSQIQLNIPLFDVLREIPKYAKYITDIVANKRRLTEFKRVALTEECSARVQSKLPPKLKNPGCFTILLAIGKHVVGRALCDLRASITLIPLSMFKQPDLGAARPTTITLQLANWSLAVPEGIIEDVLVRLGKFIFPAEFIILDYMADDEVRLRMGGRATSPDSPRQESGRRVRFYQGQSSPSSCSPAPAGYELLQDF